MEQPPLRVLVAEDEKDIRSLAIDLLEAEHCQVWVCADGEEALSLLRRESFDMILADIRMPHLTGIDLLSHIRSLGLDTRVVLMTAYSSEETLLEALRGGACEYLPKPFLVREFRQRVGDVLDKIRDQKRQRNPIVYKQLILDEQARRAWMDNRELALTRLEFNVLAYLCRSQGRRLTPEELLQHAWRSEDGEERTRSALKSVIYRLREKLHDDPHDPQYIRNIWGVGYQFGE